MRVFLITIILLTSLFSCSDAQEKFSPQLVGGPCEGCEAVFEYGDRSLSAVDTLPGFHQSGTQIKVKGTIYESDGKTPAKDVILYVYHTDQSGRYTPQKKATGWARRHGSLRGWMKTDETGAYAFYTLRPAPYPNGSEPAHIHYTILEPNGQYYWLGSCHFEGDSLLTEAETNPESPRGGTSGLLTLRREGDLWVGTRNIILGRHVPGWE